MVRRHLLLSLPLLSGMLLACIETIVGGEVSVPTSLITGGVSPISEPYPPLSGGDFTGPAVPESADPLVRYRWHDPKTLLGFQLYLLRPVAAVADFPASFENVSSLTTEQCHVAVKGMGSIRFDFGTESAGWLEFDSPNMSGDVAMSISEHNEPGVVNFDFGTEHPIKTLPPKRYGNTYRLELNKELYEGVRFGWIHVRKFDKPWHITAVRLVCRVKPTNYEGSFSCSNPLLTRIWHMGAYTVKVNLLKEGLGSILIDRGDRLIWTVECGSSLPASLAAFGNWDLLKTHLIKTKGDANGIEVNVLHWIIGLLDYYRYTGDAATLKSLLPDVITKLDHANAIYSDPKQAWFAWDERAGVGGDYPNVPEAKNGYRMTFVRVSRQFAQAMEMFGRADLRDKYQAIADQRVAELRKNAKWYEPFGLFAGGAAINAGIATPQEMQHIFAREFADRISRLANCPFDVYYNLQAMSRMGRHDVALAMVRDHWGGQIDYGATTLFEVYRPQWNQYLGKNDPPPSDVGYPSLAHPWGSGVTSWLTEEVLGIKPTAPGFSRVDILPHLGRTLTWVAGGVPTPRGTVAARFDMKSGECEVTIPLGSLGHIGVPKAERYIRSVAVNGQLAWDGEFHALKGLGGARSDSEFVHLVDVQPGKYTLAVAYEGVPPPFVDVPYVYPIAFVKEDAATHGDWGGVYGKDGYVLFNYDGVAKDRRKLPGYVQEVTNIVPPPYAKPLNVQMAKDVTDCRALSGEPTNAMPRNVGCLHTNYPGAFDVTMTLNVVVKPNTKYQLALYVLGWNNPAQRQVVEVFDLATLKLAAPVQMVRDFGEGKYLVYQCDRPVRLRINRICNGNPILNGLFFDPIQQ